MTNTYPKRLIEVDLPIARISAHARREKSIRHGHISTLHIWWARRPLASCRAVICASLWPDPVDLAEWADRGEDIPTGGVIIRPQRFLAEAREQMARRVEFDIAKASADSLPRLFASQKDRSRLDDPLELRNLLLDFIADFSDWDNSADPAYVATARALTQAAHESLGGARDSMPLVVDPFAGGGSIPLEALRVGADAFASDLNPIAVLLNKVMLEYIPKHGSRLADEVRRCGEWVKDEAERSIADLYSKNADGAVPIAYLWARTATCEGPGCGVRVPLVRNTTLLSKSSRSLFLELSASAADKAVCVQLSGQQGSEATIRGGKMTCPACGHTTPAKQVMAQMAARRGGSRDAQLLAIVATAGTGERGYYVADDFDNTAQGAVHAEMERLAAEGYRSPVEHLNSLRPSPNARGLSAVTRFGMTTFSDLYTPRQLVAILTFQKLAAQAASRVSGDMADALNVCLELAVSRLVDRNSSLCRWIPQTGAVGYTFGRQALSMIWDFVEINPLTHSGGWTGAVEDVATAIEKNATGSTSGTAVRSAAQCIPLPDDSAPAVITDPPYYDSIPYADLSDFFYAWMRPQLQKRFPELFDSVLTPKDDEAIWNPSRQLPDGRTKDKDFYESAMLSSLQQARRVVEPSGISTVVFAHKSTAGWEALLQAMVDAGWVVVASWPIDTERGSRTNAIGTASLASSVHLVCRPRENPDGTLRAETGDWREILAALPTRIHQWMPRLAEEGVVGADAIFACLGPALELFSRFSRVEKSSGEPATLREYLEKVWAAVSWEALSMIFDDPQTAGLEPDARLTAMWLWTLGEGRAAHGASVQVDVGLPEEDEEESARPTSQASGYVLEFDTARKIAQGLGIHIEKAPSVVELMGDKARLLPVAERTEYLFGATSEDGRVAHKGRRVAQLGLFEQLQELEVTSSNPALESVAPEVGRTVLDRVHQAMILFADGRGEALKRFLVEDGVGKQAGVWRLAQALSALYPIGSDEKRSVDGVLARRKALGL